MPESSNLSTQTKPEIEGIPQISGFSLCHKGFRWVSWLIFVSDFGTPKPYKCNTMQHEILHEKREPLFIWLSEILLHTRVLESVRFLLLRLMHISAFANICLTQTPQALGLGVPHPTIIDLFG